MNKEGDSPKDYLSEGKKEMLSRLYVQHRQEFVQWCIRTYGVSSNQAMEAYQDATIIFYENILTGKVEEFSSTAKTYLFAIGKNKLREFFRASVKLTTLEQEMLNQLEDAPEEGKEDFFECLERNFEKLNERCRELLNLFYFKKMTMDQITDQLSYKNVDSSKNQKYKCLKQLREYCEMEVPQ